MRRLFDRLDQDRMRSELDEVRDAFGAVRTVEPCPRNLDFGTPEGPHQRT